MDDFLRVGTAKARLGQTVRGVIPVGHSLEGPIEIPIIVIRGRQKGASVWIDGGTHGDEPEGTLACWAIAEQVRADELVGTLVLAPMVNLAAIRNASRGNPLDPMTHDLNRVFPGKAEGSPTERLAWAYHQEIARSADLVISIHSGGSQWYLSEVVYPNNAEAVTLARTFGPGWDLIVEPAYGADDVQPSGTLAAVMAAQGKPCLTIELGGIAEGLGGPLRRNSRRLADACLNLMRSRSMIPGPILSQGSWTLARERLVLASVGGFWTPDQDFQFRKRASKGTVLARIADAYGDVVEEIVAPCDGAAHGIRTKHSVTLPGEWCLFFHEVASVLTL